MASYKQIPIGNQFIRNAAVPIDRDFVFATSAERIAYLDRDIVYSGMIAADLQTNKVYMINSSMQWQEVGITVNETFGINNSGILVKTGNNSYRVGGLNPGSNIEITNPSGLTGNPSISLSTSLTDLSSIAVTGNGGITIKGTGVSLSGHFHTSNNITDFNDAVSGLIESAVSTSIVQGSGINIVYDSGVNTLTISTSSVSTSTITDFEEKVEDQVARLLNAPAESGIVLNYIDGNANGGSGTLNIGVNKTALGLNNVQNIALSGVVFIAGSGLVGGGDLSANRTLDIGQGDGISVGADSIAVNSTVVRTFGNQTIEGVKTFDSSVINLGLSADTTIINLGKSSYGLGITNTDGDATFGNIGPELLIGEAADNNPHLTTKLFAGSNGVGVVSFYDTYYDTAQEGDGIVANRLYFQVEPAGSTTPGNTIIKTSDITGTVALTLPNGNGIIARLSDINTTQITGVLSTTKGGTGRLNYSDGQLLIGSGNSLAANTLTPTSGIGILNGSGTITISVTGIPSSRITNFNSSVSELLPTIANSGNNRILTSTGSTVGINAEDKLTFDGNRLICSGEAIIGDSTYQSIQVINGIVSIKDDLGRYLADFDETKLVSLGIDSINWGDRKLINSSGLTVLNWDSSGAFETAISAPTGNFFKVFVGGQPVSVSGHLHTSSNITDFNSSVSGLVSGLYVPVSRTITPGSGLVGTSPLDLTANRTFDIGAGDGISVGTNSIAVDSTVVRTFGDQNTSGIKVFDNIVVRGANSSPAIIFDSNFTTDFSSLDEGSRLGISVGSDGDGLTGDPSELVIGYDPQNLSYNENTRLFAGPNGVGVWRYNDGNGYINRLIFDVTNVGTINNQSAVTTLKTKNTAGNVTINLPSSSGTLALLTDINSTRFSGVLPVTKGGTGATTLTLGNLLVGNGTGAISGAYSVETTLAGSATAIPRADAVKSYVDSQITAGFNANDAMQFKGLVTQSSGLPTSIVSAGWTYRVAETGIYAGAVCQVGDMIIAVVDASGINNNTWTVVQTNIDGAVVGPVSATSDNFALFDNTTGKVIKDAGFGSGVFAASSHSHGNISPIGAIGSEANRPIITTTNGVLTTGTFGITANSFCQGNDPRLSDTRNTTNSLTVNDGGAGDSLFTFNGSSNKTLSYNSIGAPSISGANAVGTWNISVSGNAASADTIDITTTSSNINNLVAVYGTFGNLAPVVNNNLRFDAANNILIGSSGTSPTTKLEYFIIDGGTP